MPTKTKQPKTDSMEETKNMTKQGWKNFVENCSLGGGTDAIGDWYMFYKEDVLSFISQELSTFAKEVDKIIGEDEHFDSASSFLGRGKMFQNHLRHAQRQALTNLKKKWEIK